LGYIGQAPANKAVKTADIEDSAITAAKIADGTVVAGELASDSVTTAKILNANVTTAKLAADAVDGTKLADDAVNSEHYTDGSIDTAHIADDQITLAKMASGTDGNIISYDASGNPVAIATGNDGQVLTSAGAGQPPAFEAAAGFDVTSITGATALTVDPAATDEMVISDAGTLKRLDLSLMQNQPACYSSDTGHQDITSHVATIITFDDSATGDYDVGGCYNATNGTVTLNGLTAPAYSFTPNVPGVYQFIVNHYWAGEGVDHESANYVAIQMLINGSHYTKQSIGAMEHGHYDDNNIQGPAYINNVSLNGTGDYVQFRVWNITDETTPYHHDYGGLTVHRLIGIGHTAR